MAADWLTKEEFLSSENGGQDLTREEMVQEMVWHDNVGMLDDVDLDNLSDDELRSLRAEIIVYFINRQRAWMSAYDKGVDTAERE
jgi:hypothetical protein